MDDNIETKKEGKSYSKLILYIFFLICFILIISYHLFSAPINNKDVIIHISANDSLSKISNELETRKIVKYSFVSKLFIYILSGDQNISSGDYLFEKDSNVFKVSWQISKSIHKVSPVRITIKEGMTNDEISSLFADKISAFRKDLFLSDERSKQGYLFPDTYFIYPLATNDEILNEISSNFKKKISSINKDIEDSGKSLSDIIIMASILEKEAKGKEDSPIISGILWKRIDIGMPLQVDAYRETYKEAGLPKNPISNPGLSSILSAIHKVETPYLFYLHDDNGKVYYAKDFSEHRSNISKYLK